MPAAVCSSCVTMPSRRIVISNVAQPEVRDRKRRAAELADDAEVGREAALAEEVRQVLAAAAAAPRAARSRRSRARPGTTLARASTRAASAAQASAPFMSAVPRP